MPNKTKKIHLISIGGSVMHNLALALKAQGHKVQGSDDEILEPSKTRLAQAGLLPKKIGWQPESIDKSIDFVILGMHARSNNPELIKAQSLNIPVLSFPEYIYKSALNKKRVAIAGSHGKTTVTAMILHALKSNNQDCDFIVGALIPGFDIMAKISEKSPVLIAEADEYPSSAIDPRPKFLWYHPHISVITGIAWDHMNVFKTESQYLNQFEQFLDMHEKGATIFFNQSDYELTKLVKNYTNKINLVPYSSHPFIINNRCAYLVVDNQNVPVSFFGKHNYENVAAALLICKELGLSNEQFYQAIKSFQGANLRMQKIYEKGNLICYRDFAHAPSKVRASTNAIRSIYPKSKILACAELHTFSSLNKKFLPQYKGSLEQADIKIVYYNPEVVKHKQLADLNPEEVKSSFSDQEIIVVTSVTKLEAAVINIIKNETKELVLLFMSSGNFGGLNIDKLLTEI